ncbi:hypothetical protein, partial [Bradyrhizobium sp. NBAIM08]|uniref:hypothetical protein n=1 Tax=Bradyrhizobium sp. NBAIM08 TaxID=2793815 RepID=UPI001CD4F07A
MTIHPAAGLRKSVRMRSGRFGIAPIAAREEFSPLVGKAGDQHALFHFISKTETNAMARVTGSITLEGTIDNVTFVKTKDGLIARKRTSLTGAKMAANPNFNLLR